MKHYLGDGVYADWDGYNLILTAENGIAIIETIILEPEVFAALVAYVDRLTETPASSTESSS